MPTKRIIKTRIDGVKQAYHTGRTPVEPREAVVKPNTIAPAPLAPAPAKQAENTFPIGFDDWGYDKQGLHAETGTQYSPDGWNLWGYDARGVSHTGWHENGKNVYSGTRRDKDGYTVDGFGVDGIHRETGTAFNPEGLDAGGRNADGVWDYAIETIGRDGFQQKTGVFAATGGRVNTEGFNYSGIHQTTRTKTDPSGFSMHGWNADGIHRETGTAYDPDGFSESGISQETGGQYNFSGLDFVDCGRAASPTRGRYTKEKLLMRRERDFPKPGDPARKTPAEVWTSPAERRAAARAARGASTPRPRTSSAPFPPESKSGISSIFGDRVQLYMPGASDTNRDNLAEAIRRAYLKR